MKDRIERKAANQQHLAWQVAGGRQTNTFRATLNNAITATHFTGTEQLLLSSDIAPNWSTLRVCYNLSRLASVVLERLNTPCAAPKYRI